MNYRGSLSEAIKIAKRQLAEYGDMVPVSRWQGVETGGHFRELINHSFSAPIPPTVKALQEETQPNLPWAENHFQERVGGEPLNPGKTFEQWPYWHGQDESMRRLDGKFSHTYMERFWPKMAEGGMTYHADEGTSGIEANRGVRFTYGDLNDVVMQLVADPYTRQAYLPVFFPEDTGAVHGERVPCSLGYHFMMRRGHLHCWYDIRSCDIVHYFQDDIYLACRLTQWVLNVATTEFYLWKMKDPKNMSLENPFARAAVGDLNMNIHSLHVFSKDFHVIS